MAKKKHRKKSPNKTTNKIAKRKNKASRQLLLFALAIAFFGFLLYSNTLTHGYVLDDFSQIKENFVTQQGIEGITTQWTTHARYGYRPGPGELYRPIPMSMFSLEWEFMPDTPALSHFINVLLYALTGAVLFLTLVRVMKGYNVLFPLLTTLFFIAHPVHVEVVANIKSRDEILMFLMAILAINFLWKYLDQKKTGWFVASLSCYLLALFSKENAVTFVAIIPLFLYFFAKIKTSKIITYSVFYALLAGFFVLIRSKVIGAFGNPSDVAVLDNFIVAAEGIGSRVSTSFLLLGKYLSVLVFPHPLGSDYGYLQIPVVTFADWRVIVSFLFWISAGLYALIKLSKKNLWAFIILFFIINFSIFSNLVLTIGTSFGERLLYAASPAFAMALALLLMQLFKIELKVEKVDKINLDIFLNKKLWGVAGLILLLYSAKTFSRNYDWESSYLLYKADIEVAPNSAKLNFHYGLELVKNGNDASNDAEKKSWYEMAKTHIKKAIEIYPEYHDAYGQLGLAFYREKNFEEALKNYNLALKYRPNFALVHSNMGTLYSEKGDQAKAKELYEKAVAEDPRMVDALRNLGAINAQQKNFTEAIKWFSQALKYAPEDPTINRYLGFAYRDLGQPEKGRPFLEKADRLENQ